MLISIDEIQKYFLPVSKKKIRSLVKKYLPEKIIGGRIYTNREELERLLSDPERILLPL